MVDLRELGHSARAQKTLESDHSVLDHVPQLARIAGYDAAPEAHVDVQFVAGRRQLGHVVAEGGGRRQRIPARGDIVYNMDGISDTASVERWLACQTVTRSGASAHAHDPVKLEVPSCLCFMLIVLFHGIL